MNTHLKFNIAPEKLSSERKVVFQPPFFRGYVKLQGCRLFFHYNANLAGKTLVIRLPLLYYSASSAVIRDQILILRDLEGRELRLDIYHLLLDPRNRRVFQISAVMSFFAMVQNLLGEVKAMVASAYTLIGHTASVSCTSSPEPGVLATPPRYIR